MSHEMPEGWRSVRVGDIAEIRTGGTPNRTEGRYWGGEIPWMASGEIHQRYVSETAEKITQLALRESNARILPVGSIMLALNGQGKTRGKAAILRSEMACNQSLAAIIPSTSHVPEFLLFLFESMYSHLRNLTGDDARSGLNLGILKALEISLPPIHEQRRIAEILSSVDETIAAMRAVIEQTRKVKQGVLERLLTKGIGHTRFKHTEIGEIPEGWGLCSLAEIAKIKHGYAFSGEFFSREEGSHILLTPGNFSKEKTLYFGPNTKFYQGPIPSDFILKNGDLLVVMTDLTPSMDILGNAVILSSDKTVLHNQRIGKVEVDGSILSAAFVKHVLNSERVQRQIKNSASGTTVRHTSPSRILENIAVLPPMAEQLLIVEALRNIDDGLELQIENLERAASFKSALMSDLLTGRKRVTDVLPMAAE